jgi:hypothetical protein
VGLQFDREVDWRNRSRSRVNPKPNHSFRFTVVAVGVVLAHGALYLVVRTFSFAHFSVPEDKTIGGRAVLLALSIVTAITTISAAFLIVPALVAALRNGHFVTTKGVIARAERPLSFWSYAALFAGLAILWGIGAIASILGYYER